MNRGLWLACSLALGTAFAASGCYMGPQPPPPAYVEPAPAPVAANDGTVYPTTPPPDPIPEYQPPAPAYGYSWVGGYWDWVGFEWSWNAGYWAPADQAYLFVGPRFLFVDGRPVYYRPYWQGPGGYRAYGYGYRGRAPVGAWRARPSVAPGAWRAEHNEGWRRTPGAGGWRGAPARGPEPMRGGNPGFRGAPPAARGPAPGFHPAPAPAFHPAPAAHSAPSRGGGGGGGRVHH
jgi:hypothetical protein